MMKKLVLVAFLLLIPFSAFALDSMSDADLDNTTAQAGVTITLNNVVVQGEGAISAWGDMASGTQATDWVVQETTASHKKYSGTVEIDVVPGGTHTGVTGTAVQITITDLKIEDVGNNPGTTTVLSLQSGDTPANVVAADNGKILGVQYATNGTTTIGGQVLISAH